MSFHLFLDLEDTVIEPIENNNWKTTKIINVDKVKEILDIYQPDNIHIYSYAIWNEQERVGFVNGTQGYLEDALDVKFDKIFRVDEDIIPEAVSVRCPGMMGVTFCEMSNYWSKQETFKYNVRAMFDKEWLIQRCETHVLLLDDSVWDEDFYYHNLHIQGSIININNYFINMDKYKIK